MSNEVPAATRGSIRALIGELAQIEDAVRHTKTFTSTGDDGTDPVLNPELVALFEREAAIVAALRRTQSPGTPARSVDRPDAPVGVHRGTCEDTVHTNAVRR